VPALVLLILGFRLVEDVGHEAPVAQRFTVLRVIDGDTFELTGGDRVRMLTIDTPERGQPLYDSARTVLEGQVMGRPVDLQFAGPRRDRYGRLLAYVYVDTLLVNALLVRQGLAYVYLFDDTDMSRPEVEELMQAQKIAIMNEAGMHGLARAQESYYVARQGSLRFHRPDCPSIANTPADQLVRFETREEALLRGLAPARNCRP
jgi:micrococcal nuclease